MQLREDGVRAELLLHCCRVWAMCKAKCDGGRMACSAVRAA